MTLLKSFTDPDRVNNATTSKPTTKIGVEKDTKTKQQLAIKSKIPTAKIDNELEKQWKEMEDISITKMKPKEETANTTLVKLIVQGDKVTAKPTMKRPQIKQGLIPGEGKILIK